MELEVFDIIVFVTGIIVGFGGALIFRAFSKKNALDKHQSAGATIEALQHEMDRRQVLADDHFLQLHGHLAAAEKKLAEARKAVFEGAATLSTVQLDKNDQSADASEDDSDISAPPRDYADYATGGGTLSENYGLHKPAEDEPKRAF